ncbi:hypothetical protein GE09DRAFT_1277005 [Coniochaeta sp. 2T2.1]|nr:hypothetical protein GE09DRAFT_1277005 [Coniochaeta sp. 2T2.1]
MSSRDATTNHPPTASSAPSPQHKQHPAVTPSGAADAQSATAPASSPKPSSTSYPRASTAAVADAEDADAGPAGSSPSTSTTPAAPATTKPTHQAPPPPPLPAPEPGQTSGEGATTTIEVNGARVSLADQLGPAVVNADGTMSRIANWGEMSEVERRNTVRVLGKRNKLRLEALREGLPKEE